LRLPLGGGLGVLGHLGEVSWHGGALLGHVTDFLDCLALRSCVRCCC
jgi:hypothetical protein